MSTIPDEDVVLGWFESLSNWGRWGDDDQLGTLNLVSPEHRIAAARLVTEGHSVSCAWDIRRGPQPGVMVEPQRYMLATGQGITDSDRVGLLGPRAGGAMEFIGFAFHGFAITHIDSLAHLFWDGMMYNGKPASLVNEFQGALSHDILPVREGIVTRGVLLDIAATKGVEVLAADDPVMPEDLDAAEERQGVRVGPGDVLFMRTGESGARVREGRRYDPNRARSGYQAACLPWLHERGVAMIGSDVAQDVSHTGYPTVNMPIHMVGIVAMGLWLIDNCNLETLAHTCTRLNRWEFLLTIGALPMQGVTGSPANPIAVF